MPESLMLTENIAQNCTFMYRYLYVVTGVVVMTKFAYLFLSIVGYSSEGNGRRMCYIMQTDAEVVETRN